jgi:hypothetical protein
MKFTLEGHIEIRFSIVSNIVGCKRSTLNPQTYLLAEVEDTGIGIKMENKK